MKKAGPAPGAEKVEIPVEPTVSGLPLINFDDAAGKAKEAVKSLAEVLTEAFGKVADKLDGLMGVQDKWFKLTMLQLGRSATAFDKIKHEKNLLQKQQEILNREIANMEKLYQALKKAKGRESQEALDMENRLLDAKIRLAEITNDLDKMKDRETIARRRIAILDAAQEAAGYRAAAPVRQQPVTEQTTTITKQIVVNNYYPEPEPAPDATRDTLLRLQYVGAM
jgi:hypothetical protein